MFLLESDNSEIVEDGIPLSDRVMLDHEIEKHRKGLWINENTTVPDIHPEKRKI